jgi:prolipoprotein diacylglyceryltransferase
MALLPHEEVRAYEDYGHDGPGLAVATLRRIGCFCKAAASDAPAEFRGGRVPARAPAAMRYPDPDSAQGCSLPVHPTQLYECVANFAIFGILMALGGRLKPGCLSALYLLLYGVMRFTVECFRGTTPTTSRGLDAIAGDKRLPDNPPRTDPLRMALEKDAKRAA